MSLAYSVGVAVCSECFVCY